MSSAPDMARASGFGSATTADSRKLSANWIWRPLFGSLLAIIAVAATVRGGLPFVVFLSLGCAAAIREWHRMFANKGFLLPTIVSISAMVAALLCQLYATQSGGLWLYAPMIVLILGGAVNLGVGFLYCGRPLAHAAGVFYIALPAVSLLMLRQLAPNPIWLVVLTFLAVWATDTGALFSGKLIGGPKLAPQLSPKKTWAGSIGGLACAVFVCGAVALLLHATLLPVILFAAMLSVAGQIGDLFESMVKRAAGRKDSGGLIPGHGGVLDRIDSMLFAAPVAVIAVLGLGLDPLLRLHP